MTDDEIERAMLGVWQDVPGAVNFGIPKQMTDRELLELAAKAAGLKIIKWGESDYYSHRDGEVAYVCATGQNSPWGDEWQPLDDDGDALQLAVKLGLLIDCDDVLQDVEAVLVMRDHDDQYVRMNEPYGDDPYAATRRAIVRAAAEIGREME